MKPLLTITGFALLLLICEPKQVYKECKQSCYGLNMKLCYEIVMCGGEVVYDEGFNSPFEWADSMRAETIKRMKDE